MLELPFLSEHTPFPNVSQALREPNGLLAFGGSLDVNRLFTAYTHGIFPWFSHNEPILWWSPDPRAIIELDGFYTSSSLRKLIKKQCYQVTLNYNFNAVIEACSSVPRFNSQTGTVSKDTWITDSMQRAYKNLHLAGLAHSVEVWDEQESLVGGLYGVAVGKVFCGESMFHKQSNTSKLAMCALVTHMKSRDLAFIDCQLPTPHLSSLGAKSLSRSEFISRLRQHNQTLDERGNIAGFYRQCWTKQVITP